MSLAFSNDDQPGASVGAFSSAVLYGRGVFTTVAVFDGKPFLWRKHWRRLMTDSSKIGVDIITAFDELSVQNALADQIRNGGIVDGRARITFFDETRSPIWGEGGSSKSSISIITAERRKIPGRIKLTISAHRVNTTSPLAGVKSCNYLENVLAHEEAKEREFDEAIRLNEGGYVTGGCMSNVFWLEDGRMFTPALATGCLPGTTREYVLENLECSEVEAGVTEIERADAIFLTSAGIGVVTVGEFNGRKMPERKHPILELIPA